MGGGGGDASPKGLQKKKVIGPKGPIMRVMPRGIICMWGITSSLWTFPRCYLRVHEKQNERVE